MIETLFKTWDSAKRMKDRDLDARNGIIAERLARIFRRARIHPDQTLPPRYHDHNAKLEFILLF